MRIAAIVVLLAAAGACSNDSEKRRAGDIVYVAPTTEAKTNGYRR